MRFHVELFVRRTGSVSQSQGSSSRIRVQKRQLFSDFYTNMEVNNHVIVWKKQQFSTGHCPLLTSVSGSFNL